MYKTVITNNVDIIISLPFVLVLLLQLLFTITVHQIIIHLLSRIANIQNENSFDLFVNVKQKINRKNVTPPVCALSKITRHKTVILSFIASNYRFQLMII